MDIKYSVRRTSSVYETATDKSPPGSLICQYPSSLSLSSIKPVSLNESNLCLSSFQFCNKSEIDRLVSDQGLITPKHRRGSSRKVRDKSYYKGQIHLKSTEINNEIMKLQKEIDMLNIEYHTFLPYKRKAETKAMELKELQNVLANYNIVDAMLITDSGLDKMENELDDLKGENNIESSQVEELFEIRKKQETIIDELETDISQEKHITEILTTTVNPQLRESFIKLKRTNEDLVFTRTELEKELQNLKEQLTALENKCNESTFLKEVFQRLSQLRRIESERDVLMSEKTFANSSEEKEHLQQQHLQINFLLKAILRETQNLKNKIKEITTEIEKTKSEEFYPKSERSKKYFKLRTKEKIIDDFLQNYNKKFLDLYSVKKQLQNKVCGLLKNISDRLGFCEYIPRNINLDSNFSESESQCYKGKNATEKSLKSDLLKLALSLNEIECLDQKVEEEMKSLKDEIEKKENDILLFQDIESLEEKTRNKNQELILTLNHLKHRLKSSKLVNQNLQEHYEFMKKNLEQKEEFRALSKLEKRWHLVEQENVSMMEFIASNKPETSYLYIKENVKKILMDINRML